MRKRVKRPIALFLSLIMLLALVVDNGVSVFAEETEITDTVVNDTEQIQLEESLESIIVPTEPIQQDIKNITEEKKTIEYVPKEQPEGISLIAYAKESVFPENVELIVTMIEEGSEEYEIAKEALKIQGSDYEDFLALDVSFFDDKGNEVEPEEGKVQVQMELHKELFPDNIDTETLVVQHLAETEDGIKVEAVADTADMTEGIIEVIEDENVISVEFEVESFSLITLGTIPTGVSSLDGQPITQEFGEGNVQITNWQRSVNGKVYSFDPKNYTAWTWSQLNAVGSETNGMTSTVSEVWDGSRSAAHKFPSDTMLPNNKVTAINGVLYDSATWIHNGSDGTSATVYRFKGEFNIGAFDPNNYSFTVSSVVGKDIIYINDNIYVFVYPEGANITQENYTEYLAFWTGTVGDTSHDQDATFGDTGTTTVSKVTKEGLAVLTDGWSMTTIPDNIGNTIVKAYNESNAAVENFIIDVFVDDYSGGGGMYRPIINANEMTRHEFKFKKVDSIDSSSGVSGAEFMLTTEGGLKYTGTSEADGTVTMKIPEGTYTLTETKTPDGYSAAENTWTVVMNSGGNYTITGNGAESSDSGYLIKNTPNNYQLTVTKTVDKGDSTRQFAFTLCVEGKEKETFNLKHGESKVFKIPFGRSYTVTETEDEDYDTIVTAPDNVTVDGTSVSGTMDTAGATVSFVNTAKDQTLTVGKTILAETQEFHNPDQEFTFTLKTNADRDRIVNSDTKAKVSEIPNASDNYKITLKAGEKVSFSLPYGTTYEISEDADACANSGYEKIDTSENSFTETIAHDPVNINFVNKALSQKLTITNEVIGDLLSDQPKTFKFKLNVKYANENPYTEEISGIFQDEDGNYSFELNRSDNKTITFTLPKNCTYTITENDYSTDGFVTRVESAEKREATGTLGTDTNVTFTNYAPVKLSIGKTVTGNMGNRNEAFEFILKLTRKESAVNYVGEPGILGEPTISGENGDYTVKLKHNERIDLIIPYETIYSVEESDYSAQGYTTSYKMGSTGTSAQENSISNQIITEDVEIWFTNDKSVISPTGLDVNVMPYALITIVAVIAAMFFFMRRPRRN